MPDRATAQGSRARRPSGRPMLALAALILLSLSVAPATASAPAAGEWAELDSGRLGDYLWSVKAKHAGTGARTGSRAAKSSCLVVRTKWNLGPYDFRITRYRRCGDGSSRLAPTQRPLIVSGELPRTPTRPKLTTVGMIFSAAIRRVRVTLADGSRRTIRLDRLSSFEARSTGLERVSYAAFSVRGPWCAERLVSQSAAGRTLWDSGAHDLACGADGSAD
ncbi:MAG TPA: hypothetical protein VFZ41_06960 [Solirubrobacterales bacterium]